jgi:hypothetical protein
MVDPSGIPEVSLSLLATGVLLSLFGPVAVKVLERLMGGAPAWVWRLAAFLCCIAGWAIVLLNDPVKAQAKLHPRGFGLATLIVLILAVLLVRSRVFNLAPAQGDASEKSNQRARVERWRKMIVLAERKYKGGKESGVSFAEIVQRQPAYLELEPYLSTRALSALGADREGHSQIVGKVDGKEFINPPDHLRSILANELNRIELAPDLLSALRQLDGQNLIGPQIDITFDVSQPEFVDPTEVTDERGVTWPCKLYRVTVTSHSSSPVTSLRAKGVKNTTKGRTYPPLNLRITGKNDSQKEIRLHKGEPQFWDVVEKKDSERDWAMLRETDIPGGHLLRVPSEFMITASCDDGLNVTKRVILGSKETGDLDFRLADP